MKKLIYILIFAIFIFFTIYNAKIIQNKKNKNQPSIVLEWKEKGVPVTVEKASFDKLKKEIKISGKLINKKIKAKIPFSTKNLIYLNQNFYLDGNNLIKGKVTYVSKEENTLYGMYNVELTLNKYIKKLQNEIVVARLEYQNKENKILIPNKAIVRDNGSTFVWINKDKKAYKKEINLGDSSIKKSEVISGLSKKDQIIIEGKEFLEKNIKIRPVREL